MAKKPKDQTSPHEQKFARPKSSKQKSLTARTTLPSSRYDDLGDSDDESAGRYLLTSQQIAKRYSISAMTLWRWEADAEMQFPKPKWIRRRKYWDVASLAAWERSFSRGDGVHVPEVA